MRLVVTTPTAVVADMPAVAQLRAEDETGGFGIRPGHADFLTALPVSVMSWRDEAGEEGVILVRGGVLSVSRGELIEVAARGATREGDLATLRAEMEEELRQIDESEDKARTSDTRLHLAMMRQIDRLLNASRADRPLPSLAPSQPGEAQP